VAIGLLFPPGMEASRVMDDTLRYLPAHKVAHRYGSLGPAAVISQDDRLVGQLDGVVIDPAGRKLRYLVVRTLGFLGARHRLVPADWPVQLDREANAVRIRGGGPVSRCAVVDPRKLPAFGDDDVLDAIFGQVA
jgi:PRC-barrel domain